MPTINTTSVTPLISASVHSFITFSTCARATEAALLGVAYATLLRNLLNLAVDMLVTFELVSLGCLAIQVSPPVRFL
jgi:hypothetical protein